ncbi:MAG: SGNH/GDSL hydrolase family protein, partial [Firmicutes bacterium]|nr:SGNH/GDSL hydrolase family protein [Bacillota bacterium]
MLYLALGDSITHGYEASAPANRYVARLTARLCEIAPTHVHVCAKPGWTASQLRRAVDRLSTCLTHEADLVTLMIGGNDMLKLA